MSLPYSKMSRRLAAPESDVWQVHEEAMARRAAGEDVTILSLGDPDFPTPDFIAQHTVARIRQGRTHYSPPAGEDALRQAIADLESNLSGRRFGPEQFVILPGATAALYALFACLLDPGDEVIVPEPMYIGYRGVFDAIGAALTLVPLKLPDFELSVADIFAAVTDKTRAVLVNTPGNPCGNILAPELLRELAAGCRQRDLWFVCDEVYSLITFDTPHVSALRVTDDLSNVVVVDGLSKSHAMSGWRVGWVVAPPALVNELVRFSSAAFFGVCQFVQDGAAHALANDAPDVERMRAEYRKRRDYAVKRLEAIPELGFFRPAAGMFIMVDGSKVANDGADFARRLLDEAAISTIPGRGFGPTSAAYVRLSLTAPLDVLETVFDRLATLAHSPAS